MTRLALILTAATLVTLHLMRPRIAALECDGWDDPRPGGLLKCNSHSGSNTEGAK